MCQCVLTPLRRWVGMQRSSILPCTTQTKLLEPSCAPACRSGLGSLRPGPLEAAPSPQFAWACPPAEWFERGRRVRYKESRGEGRKGGAAAASAQAKRAAIAGCVGCSAPRRPTPQWPGTSSSQHRGRSAPPVEQQHGSAAGCCQGRVGDCRRWVSSGKAAKLPKSGNGSAKLRFEDGVSSAVCSIPPTGRVAGRRRSASAALAGLPEANRWGGWEGRHPAALPRRGISKARYEQRQQPPAQGKQKVCKVLFDVQCSRRECAFRYRPRCFSCLALENEGGQSTICLLSDHHPHEPGAEGGCRLAGRIPSCAFHAPFT